MVGPESDNEEEQERTKVCFSNIKLNLYKYSKNKLKSLTIVLIDEYHFACFDKKA